MTAKKSTFNIELMNIPLYNLRVEFAEFYTLINDPTFRSKFNGPPSSIDTKYFTWHSLRSSLLTLLLQRSIYGLEAWILGAVEMELIQLDRTDEDTMDILNNPFNLRGKSLPEKFFVSLPRVVHDSIRMDINEPELWKLTKSFYKEIRNPIIHGFEIESESVDNTVPCFEMINNIYEWIDSWHDPSAMSPK